jgi:tetratricopeptide (TPR) repeat protein
MRSGLRTSIALLLWCSALRAEPAYKAFADVFDHDDPVRSEERLNVLAEDAKSARDSITEAEILTQMARAVALEKRFSDAEALLRRAAALAPHSATVALRCSLEHGRVLRLQGMTAQADTAFHDAYARAAALHDDYLLLDAVHMIALTEPFEQSRAWTERGLRLATSSPNPKTTHWIGVLNNNLGVGYFERRQFVPAEAAYERSLTAYRAEHADADVTHEAQFNVAQSMRLIGRLREALRLQRALDRELGPGDGLKPMVEREITACLRTIGKR